MALELEVTANTTKAQKNLDALHDTMTKVVGVADAFGPKPGWQTSEFWLKLLAVLLTYLYASGTIPTTGPVAQVAAIAGTMLGALGYAVVRGKVKIAHALGNLGLPDLDASNDNVLPAPAVKQAGFISFGLMLAIVAIGGALLFGCGASTRMKTLGGTMATLDAVEITLQTYDTQHLAAIAADPKNDSRAKVDAETAKWLAQYAKAHDLIAKAAKLIADGYKLDDDPSLAAAEAGAADVLTFLTSLGVKL